MHHKVGDISKFAFATGKKITAVKNVDFEYIEEHTFGICPKCGEQLSKRQTFKIIELVSINNGEHYIGYSDQGHTLRILKEYIDALKEKQKQARKSKPTARPSTKKKKKSNTIGGDSN